MLEEGEQIHACRAPEAPRVAPWLAEAQDYGQPPLPPPPQPSAHQPIRLFPPPCRLTTAFRPPSSALCISVLTNRHGLRNKVKTFQMRLWTTILLAAIAVLPATLAENKTRTKRQIFGQLFHLMQLKAIHCCVSGKRQRSTATQPIVRSR